MSTVGDFCPNWLFFHPFATFSAGNKSLETQELQSIQDTTIPVGDGKIGFQSGLCSDICEKSSHEETPLTAGSVGFVIKLSRQYVTQFENMSECKRGLKSP